MNDLVNIGVLDKQGHASWIAETFIVPKREGHVCWISDFCALNSAFIRRHYPIPRIQDILSHHTGYKYLTKPDLSIQYYIFKLDEDSHNLCTMNRISSKSKG